MQDDDEQDKEDAMFFKLPTGRNMQQPHQHQQSHQHQHQHPNATAATGSTTTTTTRFRGATHTSQNSGVAGDVRGDKVVVAAVNPFLIFVVGNICGCLLWWFVWSTVVQAAFVFATAVCYFYVSHPHSKQYALLAVTTTAGLVWAWTRRLLRKITRSPSSSLASASRGISESPPPPPSSSSSSLLSSSSSLSSSAIPDSSSPSNSVPNFEEEGSARPISSLQRHQNLNSPARERSISPSPSSSSSASSSSSGSAFVPPSSSSAAAASSASSPLSSSSSSSSSSLSASPAPPENNVASLQSRLWMPDNASDACVRCNGKFSLFNRKHHCRNCGVLVCDDCSTNRVMVPNAMFKKPMRVCDYCYNLLRADR